MARKTRAKVVVVVATPGATPTGTVTVKVGTRKYVGTLRSGRVVIRLATFARSGQVRLTVGYAGDTLTLRESTTKKFRVVPDVSPR